MSNVGGISQSSKAIPQTQQAQDTAQQQAPKAAGSKDSFGGVAVQAQGVALPKVAAQATAQAADSHPHLHHLEAALKEAGHSIHQICHNGLEKTEAAAKAAGHGVEHGALSFEHACSDFAKSMEAHAKAFWEAHFAKQQAAQAQKA